MSAPVVKGYMPLCVTPRSNVCDEQGVGQWPMWKRYDSVKDIVDQYVDVRYRSFLSMPYHEVDQLKAEELFYWYTPSCNTTYVRMSRTGDDHAYYKKLLDETIAHYQSVVSYLKESGKHEEANFLQLSLKYAGESEDCVYCGDNRVVATVWGMKPRFSDSIGAPTLTSELTPDPDIHTVRYDLGASGTSDDSLVFKKCHGSKVFPSQIPNVTAKDGYVFLGWDKEPDGATVTEDLLFTAQYQKKEEPKVEPPVLAGSDAPQQHKVRFLTPDGQVIKVVYVDHGKQIPAGVIPQLPLFNGIPCPSWSGDPERDVVDTDLDYRALVASKEKDTSCTVRFLAMDGSVLAQLAVKPGTRLVSGQIPDLPIVDGVRCQWDSDPLSEIITSNRDFVAKQPARKHFLRGADGCLSAILNWLLLLLGLLLLFLLLWFLLNGKCPVFGGGCDCDEKNKITPVNNPCNTTQTSGGEDGYLGYFDMGQNGGTFPFSFDTYSVPDRVTIYDGKGTSGKRIFNYQGGSDGVQNHTLSFTQQYVTVEIVGLDPGTAWKFEIGCPPKK